MKPPRFPLLAAAFVLSLCGGCGRKQEDPVKVIEEAEAALPPAEQMPPQENPPAPITPGAPDSAVAGALPNDAAYFTWFKKYGLDLADPKMLDADADGDGFSNRDEFMADTSPLDAASRPGIHQQIRMGQYTEVRLPVILESVDGETARVRRVDGEERVETVRVGETLKGLRWKVERIGARKDTDKNGDPVDLSSVTLGEIDSHERATLMKELPTRTGDTFAELVSVDGSVSMRVHEGETFRWPDATGPEYKVMDLRAEQAVVQEVATRRMWTIPKR